MDRWVALDLETTGLSPTRHEICELAAVPFEIDGSYGESVLHFTHNHFERSSGLTPSMRWSRLLQMVGERVLVAHNAAFDLAFLAEALRRARVRPFALRAYCTLRLARALLPDLPRYDLASLRETLNLPKAKPHAALADAHIVAEIFMVLAERTGFADERDLRSFHGAPLRVRLRSGTPSKLQEDSLNPDTRRMPDA